MSKIVAAKYLMIGAIFTIATFQGYWLYKLYNEEYDNIQRKADVILKETIQSLKESTLKTDSNFIQLLSKKRAASEYEVVHDTIKQNITAKYKKKSMEGATSTLDTNVKVTYFSQRASNHFANGMVDSVLKNLNPNAISRIEFNKDTSRSIKGSIIIRASKGHNVDSISTAFLNGLSKGDDGSRRMFNSLDSQSSGLKSKSNKKLNLIKRELYVTPENDQLNISNLVIKIFTDSIAPKKLDSVFKQSLTKEKVTLPYKLLAKRVLKDSTNLIDTTKPSLHTSPITIGLVNPMAYQAQFDNPFWFILKRLSLPISISFLLLSFVTLAFVFLYRNMMDQNRLAGLKSDFISNVTHELKTPIATVSVAIEALRNFNAIENKDKAKDYLEISNKEINRLSLLVENVLKLSIFENEKIELQKEHFDIVAVTKEVINALSIQIENKQATISIDTKPEQIFIYADKLQITSILFNLLDNALKYCKEKPVISTSIIQHNGTFIIIVKDNGIGISKEYQKKIFDKFFRVQSGDRHNVKGYGLGLSYVNHIVKRHKGTISVVSELEKGTEINIVLPL